MALSRKLLLFRFHLYQMLQHLVCQILVNLHLLILESVQHLCYLIGIVSFTESQITPALVHLKEVTIGRRRLLPHPLQLHLLPHLVQYTPVGINLIELLKYVGWHLSFVYHFATLPANKGEYRLNSTPLILSALHI